MSLLLNYLHSATALFLTLSIFLSIPTLEANKIPCPPLAISPVSFFNLNHV